jgi:hypothetical protein
MISSDPIKSRRRKSSPSKIEDTPALTITEMAPMGATNVAGAKP